MRRSLYFVFRREFWIAMLLMMTCWARAAHHIILVNYSYSVGFEPSYLEVNVGDSVEFRATEGAGHTVAGTGSDPFCGPQYLLNDLQPTCPKPNAPLHVMNTAGTFPYHCTIHTFMSGTIKVLTAPNNIRPNVSITKPASNGIMSATPTNIFEAVATDSDGTVKTVEFRYGINILSITNLLGVVTNMVTNITNNTFSLPVTNNFPVGIGYFLVATATDNLGGQTISTGVSFNVGPQLVQPVYTDGKFEFRFLSDTNFGFIVQSTTNLANSASWAAVSTNAKPTNNVITIISDTNAAAVTSRFYRVLLQQ